jgi:transposase-like protein
VSSERKFQPTVFYAPDKTGSKASGKTEQKNQQPNPLPNRPLYETVRTRRELPGYIPPLAGGSPRKIPISPEELVALHRDQHVSIPDLAEQFGVSQTTVYKTLDAGGFDKEARRQRLEEKGYIPSPEGDELVKVTASPEELVTLHCEQGIPVNELAKRFNVHKWTIYRKLREAGKS